jgi:ornithine decarboxylase/lysine decarboxylase/arginine decarboxylase
VLNLRKFIKEIRFKNAEIPIYLYGETRTSQHLPNDILRELHGFIHMFEDTPEFVARHIIREARSYLDSLAPPFFRALHDYAQDGSYSWHCPGHSGGVAFLKSPVGQMFHQFFGENMLRADVCNAVEELGQLLDHTGPVAASERNAARIFNADHCFFVTNGTSTSTRWCGTTRWRRRRGRGRPQLPQVDPALDHHDGRGAGVPHAHAQPLRHHRPDPARASSRARPSSARSPPTRCCRASTRRRSSRASSRSRRAPTTACSTTPRRSSTRSTATSTRCTSTSLAAARRLPLVLRRIPRDGAQPPAPKDSSCSPRSPRTSCWRRHQPGLAGAGAGRQNRKLDRHLFKRLPDAQLTRPQYAIIARCDVAAAMMEAPGGPGAGEESILESLDFRRAMRKVEQGVRQGLVDQGLGPEKSWRPTASGKSSDWISRPARSGTASATCRRLQPARPDQEHHHHAGARHDGKFAKTASRRASSPSTSPSTAWWSRRRGSTRSSSCSPIGITKGRWNTLLTALQQFKDDYDRNAMMGRVLPEFVAPSRATSAWACATCARTSTRCTPRATSRGSRPTCTCRTCSRR